MASSGRGGLAKAAPAAGSLPTWVPEAGQVAVLTNANGKLTNAFLLVCKVSVDFPDEVLFDEHYKDFCAILAKIDRQLPEQVLRLMAQGSKNPPP